MKRSSYWALGLLTPFTFVAAGCGQHPTPTATGHHLRHHHHRNSGGSVPSSSPSPSPSSTAPSNTASVPVSSPASPASPVLTSAPPAGGVAESNQVAATVNTVQADGTSMVNGQRDNVYLLNVTLHNPTTAMILFQLNDLVVAPSTSGASSSLNDYDMAGITQANSLFPYPIVPTHPNAVVVRVPSGRSVSGNFTVEVPNATSYSVSIAGTKGVVATFSS